MVEVVLDIGRRPEARFSSGVSYLSYRTVVWQDLEYVLKRLGKFSGDNRAGIEKTLHRISALKNRKGGVIGLTCRIGRAIFGTVSIICDLLEKRKSILLLGRPGVGKTTAIREIARVLSDDMKKQVRESLKIKDQYVTRIIEQDVQVLTCIESAKNQIIRELQNLQKSKKAVGGYKVKTFDQRLNEEV